MGTLPLKKVVNVDPGDADTVGGDDWDDLADYLNNVDKTGPVKINTKQYFRSGKLEIRNPADTFSYIHVGAALAANRNVNWPLLTADDTPTFNDFAATLSNKTLASSTVFPSTIVKTDQSNTYGSAYNQIFHSGRLHILTPDDINKYWIHGQNIVDEFDLILPLITGTDYIVAQLAEATLSNKVLDDTCDVSDALAGERTFSGATVDINATAAETDLLNYVVPASSMCTNGSVKFLISGYLLQNQASGTTYTFKVKFGTTVMWEDVSPSIAQSATKIPFRINGEISNKNSTSAQCCSGYIIVNDTTAATTGLGDISSDTNTSPPAFSGNFDSEGADTTKDTTVDQTLQVTVTMSVNNSAVHTVVKHKEAEVRKFT